MDDDGVPTRNSNTSSRELPDEIIIEILSRMTSKDLGRSNCVLKQWRDLFTIQAFKQRHFNSLDIHNTTPHYTVLFPNYKPPMRTHSFEMLSFEIPRNYIKNENKSLLVIEGKLQILPLFLSKYSTCSNICDGLVCIYNTWLDSLSYSSIVLYSTRTNDVLIFPTTTNLGDLSTLNTKMRVFCLIGFDTRKKEYKIVRSTTHTTGEGDEGEQSLGLSSYETLTLGSRSWNQIDNAKVPLSLSLGWESFYGNGLYLNGSVFWVQIDEPQAASSEPYICSYTLAAFDLNNEEFRVFNLDSILLESSFGLNVGCYVAEIRSCPTAFAFKHRADGYDDMLMCAFSDCKMTSVVWSRTIRRTGFVIRTSVSESRVIVQPKIFDYSHSRRSGTWNDDVLYYICEDLENDISFEVVIKD